VTDAKPYNAAEVDSMSLNHIDRTRLRATVAALDAARSEVERRKTRELDHGREWARQVNGLIADLAAAKDAAREVLGLARDTTGWCECGDGDMCRARIEAAQKVAALAAQGQPAPAPKWHGGEDLRVPPGVKPVDLHADPWALLDECEKVGTRFFPWLDGTAAFKAARAALAARGGGR
jgi:hypothetical protein